MEEILPFTDALSSCTVPGPLLSTSAATLDCCYWHYCHFLSLHFCLPLCRLRLALSDPLYPFLSATVASGFSLLSDWLPMVMVGTPSAPLVRDPLSSLPKVETTNHRVLLWRLFYSPCL